MLTGIEIIPALLLRKINIAAVLLILAYRTSHESRTEHPLILDVVNIVIAVEVHYQTTHHGIVLEVNHTRHTVEVRHQTVTEFIVSHDGLVSRMICRSNVPYLTCRPLAMSTIKRYEATELVPTRLQLAPFLQVSIFLTGLIELLLGSHIAVLYTETALVHSPERQTCHRIVQTGCHLGTHIFPTGSNVTRPGSRTVALLTGKTGTGQEEDTLVRVHAALSVIDSISIHDAVSIEIFGRCTEGSRTGKSLAVPHRGTVANVWF